MVTRTHIKKDTYYDSVTLMRVSSELANMEGIRDAVAMMGTEINKQLWADAGLLTTEAAAATANDLVIVIKADDEARAAELLDSIDTMLAHQGVAQEEEQEQLPRNLSQALTLQPEANILLISTPGPYAATEALRALMNDIHVFMFSDNVTIEDEVMLKQLAVERGLLMMGPDCGTAIINGHPLGFANVVRRGPIGMLAASGTGLQEVSSLIHRLGSGVSQAIGLGGRDLKEAVGGQMMKLGLEALADDPETKVIVLISKPPAANIAQRVLEQAVGTGKPIVVSFLGGDLQEIARQGATPAFTLEDAAAQAKALIDGREVEPVFFSQAPADVEAIVAHASAAMSEQQRWVRGLFSGGTFCTEAQLLLRDMVAGRVYSNIPLRSELKLEVTDASREHTVLDLGADEYTAGRPHPMIDFRSRIDAIRREAADPTTAVLLLDVVLGFGAHEDPARELVPVITETKTAAQEAGRSLAVVASVCGTDEDIQNRQEQVERLEAAGVLVTDSNAQAARLAALIARESGRSRNNRSGDPLRSSSR